MACHKKMMYPLLPYSQLVWEMTRWFPGIYRFPVTLLWRNGAEEKERIAEAFRTALLNHPVFSARINWRGRQYPSTLRDVLHGPYHDITLYTQGEDLYIRVSGDRILGDGQSCFVFVQDVCYAYAGKPLEKDDYWGYLARVEQYKHSEHYRQSRDWLIDAFADTSVPVRPTMDRRWLWTLLPPKAGVFEDNYSDLQKAIRGLCTDAHLILDGLFSLCTALAIADYCGTDQAALTWAYEGRERPDEQRIFGSLHRDVPFFISRKSKVESQKPASREDLIRQARNQIRSGIAHSDYPYTLTAPYNRRWNYAVNVLRVVDDVPTGSFPLEVVALPDFKHAYALLDVEIHERLHSLSLVFRYSATHYRNDSIRRFAERVKKNMLWLLNA